VTSIDGWSRFRRDLAADRVSDAAVSAPPSLVRRPAIEQSRDGR